MLRPLRSTGIPFFAHRCATETGWPKYRAILGQPIRTSSVITDLLALGCWGDFRFEDFFFFTVFLKESALFNQSPCAVGPNAPVPSCESSVPHSRRAAHRSTFAPETSKAASSVVRSGSLLSSSTADIWPHILPDVGFFGRRALPHFLQASAGFWHSAQTSDREGQYMDHVIPRQVVIARSEHIFLARHHSK